VAINVSQVHRRLVRDTSEGELLSDKSASSSTGSVQMSADSTAASTDSVAASTEMPPSATSGVVKITDIPLPDDRPHTISSAVYQPPVRPPIIPDTFGPPTITTVVTSGPPGKVAEIYSRPSLMSKDSRSNVPTAVATPMVPVAANPVTCDDVTDVASSGGRPFTDSSQHSSTVLSMLQKQKTVSLTDMFFVCSVWCAEFMNNAFIGALLDVLLLLLLLS